MQGLDGETHAGSLGSGQHGGDAITDLFARLGKCRPSPGRIAERKGTDFWLGFKGMGWGSTQKCEPQASDEVQKDLGTSQTSHP